MKKLLFTLLITACNYGVFAQTTTPNPITSKDSVYIDVDKEPEFPGGMNMFTQFLAKTLRYPRNAFMRNIEGRVVVQGIVEKDGSISNTKVLAPVSKELDAEALRVVNLSPTWNPAIKDGNPVRSSFTVPITFTLHAFH